MTTSSLPEDYDDMEILELLLEEEGVAAPAEYGISRAAGSVAPLSFAQERLWSIQQMHPEGAQYNITSAVRLSGILNVEALRSALQQIVDRHAILRTSIIVTDGKPQQHIHDSAEVDFEICQLQRNDSGQPASDSHAGNGLLKSMDDAVQDRIREEAGRPLRSDHAPMMRAVLLRLDDTEHVAILTMHHIVSDGWSMNLLIQELGLRYAGNEAELTPLAIQYADFALWQRHQLASGRMDEQVSYWKEQLAGVETLELPTDRPRPAVQTFCGTTYAFELPGESHDQLAALGHTYQATPFMTLLSAFMVLLHRCCGQEDIVVGTPIANRGQKETESLIGLFVNSLVIRVPVSGDDTFVGLLQRVRDTALEAYDRQDVPFERLVQEITPHRQASHNPLFQVAFMLEDTAAEPLELPGLKLTPVEPESSSAKFDLMLNVAKTGNGLMGVFEYNTDLFDESTIERFGNCFRHLLLSIIEKPECRVGELEMMTESDRRRLLVDWNPSTAAPDRTTTIPGLFEHCVRQAPQRTALEFQDQVLSYGELNSQSNQLARLLRSRVGDWSGDVVVGICLERSHNTIISILAVLKAGAAYAPLDRDDPPERLAGLIEDARMPLVLTDRQTADRLTHVQTDIVCLDRAQHEIAACDTDNLDLPRHGEQLAYAMYTSGSTGIPKCVGVPHRAVVRLVTNTDYVSFSADEVFLQLAPVSFDASTFEIWGALLNGARLVVAPSTRPDLVELGNMIRSRQVSTLWLTSGLFHLMVDERIQDLAPLSQLLAGGDVLSVSHVERVLRELPNCQLINGYGPTENTTFTCCHAIDAALPLPPTVPIGKPIANTHVYILDDGLRPVPIGIRGDLYISGAGLARGYLGRPALTAEVFVPDPLAADAGARMYRTGDAARWRPDGTIEFLGRIDQQVKIRGFRIEPSEIELALKRHAAVREAVVLPGTNDNNRRCLVAWLVPAADEPLPGHAQLRSFLQRSLPDYMLPAAYVEISELPLTDNGKVDRRALPEPSWAAESSHDESSTARTDIESLLVRAWLDVLPAEQIGIHDNYFELGGDSITAIQLVSRLMQDGWQLAVTDLFRNPTIAQLAECLTPTVDATDGCEEVRGLVPLTPVQLWFFRTFPEHRHHFNQAVLLKARNRIDSERLRRVLRRIQDHHPALQMVYRLNGDLPEQLCSGPGAEVSVEEFDLRNRDDAVRETEHLASQLQGSLDPERGILLKAAVFRMGDADRLLLIVHHLAVDGVSWRILLEDLEQAWNQDVNGNEIVLSPPVTSGRRWVEALTEYSAGDTLAAEIPLWRDILSRPVASLPVDGDGGRNSFGGARSVTRTLSEEQTTALLQDCHHAYQTEINDILLTALGRALRTCHGGSATRVNLEGHGREPMFPGLDISRTVGWFTSIFPFVIDVSAATIGEQICQVRDALRAIPARGVGFGVLRYLRERNEPVIVPAGDAQISFNYFGQFDPGHDHSMFTMAEESAGSFVHPEMVRPHAVDVTMMATGGKLSVAIVYQPGCHSQATVERLSDEFRKELIAVTEHCQTVASTGDDVPSFTKTDLSGEDFDQIRRLLSQGRK